MEEELNIALYSNMLLVSFLGFFLVNSIFSRKFKRELQRLAKKTIENPVDKQTVKKFIDTWNYKDKLSWSDTSLWRLNSLLAYLSGIGSCLGLAWAAWSGELWLMQLTYTCFIVFIVITLGRYTYLLWKLRRVKASAAPSE